MNDSEDRPPFAPEICDKYSNLKYAECLKDGCRHYDDGHCYFPAESLAGWYDWINGIERPKEEPRFYLELKQSNNLENLMVMTEKITFIDEETSKFVFKAFAKLMQEYKKANMKECIDE